MRNYLFIILFGLLIGHVSFALVDQSTGIYTSDCSQPTTAEYWYDKNYTFYDIIECNGADSMEIQPIENYNGILVDLNIGCEPSNYAQCLLAGNSLDVINWNSSEQITLKVANDLKDNLLASLLSGVFIIVLGGLSALALVYAALRRYIRKNL